MIAAPSTPPRRPAAAATRADNYPAAVSSGADNSPVPKPAALPRADNSPAPKPAAAPAEDNMPSPPPPLLHVRRNPASAVSPADFHAVPIASPGTRLRGAVPFFLRRVAATVGRPLTASNAHPSPRGVRRARPRSADASLCVTGPRCYCYCYCRYCCCYCYYYCYYCRYCYHSCC